MVQNIRDQQLQAVPLLNQIAQHQRDSDLSLNRIAHSNYTLVLLLLHAETESWGVLIWSPRLMHATEWILNFSLTPSKDTVIHTRFHYS
jgi:hypothetical protein